MQFKEQNVDYAVLECGLGGGLDATNILSRVACCAVTSIGRDHEEVLGYDLEDIAAEKSGIIKAGIGGCVLGPTVTGFKVFHDKFAETGCPKEKLKQILFEESKTSSGFREVNQMMAKEIVGIVLNKTTEELANVVPDKVF